LSQQTPPASSQIIWKPYSRLNFRCVPENILSWLQDASSLTQRLVTACPGKFRVEVLNEGWGKPAPNETVALAMKPGTIARIRQVRLLCDDRPWVFARTIIPNSTLTGSVRRLRLLGDKPLGAVLFADPGMYRGQLEIAPISRGSALYRDAMQTQRSRPAVIWGRRSVFYLSGKPLLVSEIFLPGLNSRQK